MFHEPRIARASGRRILSRFGLASRKDEPLPAARPASVAAERAALVTAIGQFLQRHDLAVSPENLARAHSIVTAIDQHLASKVHKRECAGQPITQDWLDENAGHDRRKHRQARELDQLARSVESSATQLGESSRTAQLAVSSYSRELEQQIAEVEATGLCDESVTRLARIARAMLDRTRDMELEMRSREVEARQLRYNVEQARHEAAVDHLTNLPNRRAFEGVFAQERDEARRDGTALCLALCDIDLFKQVNDRHGHETGDRVIRAVGEALDRISDHCHVARHGGEEFALLFRGLDLGAAARELDAARARFSVRHFVDKVSGRPIGAITFSGGIVDAFAYPDLSSALRAADEALYRAKERGRNRVERG
jgi:diguanylate cyclase